MRTRREIRARSSTEIFGHIVVQAIILCREQHVGVHGSTAAFTQRSLYNYSRVYPKDELPLSRGDRVARIAENRRVVHSQHLSRYYFCPSANPFYFVLSICSFTNKTNKKNFLNMSQTKKNMEWKFVYCNSWSSWTIKGNVKQWLSRNDWNNRERIIQMRIQLYTKPLIPQVTKHEKKLENRTSRARESVL